MDRFAASPTPAHLSKTPRCGFTFSRRPRSFRLPLWFLSGWLGLRRLNPFLRCVEVDSFSCSSVRGLAPDSQVDGEWLGQLPMQVSVVPNALRILLPQHRSDAALIRA